MDNLKTIRYIDKENNCIEKTDLKMKSKTNLVEELNRKNLAEHGVAPLGSIPNDYTKQNYIGKKNPNLENIKISNDVEDEENISPVTPKYDSLCKDDESSIAGSEQSDYTALAFDINYVKVSPPKMTRRQKKSSEGESEALVKREHLLEPNKPSSCRRVPSLPSFPKSQFTDDLMTRSLQVECAKVADDSSFSYVIKESESTPLHSKVENNNNKVCVDEEENQVVELTLTIRLKNSNRDMARSIISPDVLETLARKTLMQDQKALNADKRVNESLPLNRNRKTLADLNKCKLTTVAIVHKDADVVPVEMHSSFSSSCMSGSSVFLHDTSRSMTSSMLRNESKLTHMNWDDLLEEAKSLGIPLTRPEKLENNLTRTSNISLNDWCAQDTIKRSPRRGSKDTPNFMEASAQKTEKVFGFLRDRLTDFFCRRGRSDSVRQAASFSRNKSLDRRNMSSPTRRNLSSPTHRNMSSPTRRSLSKITRQISSDGASRLQANKCCCEGENGNNSPLRQTSIKVKSGMKSNDLLTCLHRLKQCTWYWGAVDFKQAEDLLKGGKDGSFIVRDSSDARFLLSITFRADHSTHHTRIEQYRGKFGFLNEVTSCESSDVIDFIERCMKRSREGKSLYFLPTGSKTSKPVPVLLLHPLHRFEYTVR